MMHCDFVIYQPIRIVVSFNYMLLIICVYHYTTLVQSIWDGSIYRVQIYQIGDSTGS
jgi:hypothetical protein